MPFDKLILIINLHELSLGAPSCRKKLGKACEVMVHLSSFLRTSTLKHLMGKEMLPLLTATRKWPSGIHEANYRNILTISSTFVIHFMT